MIDRQFSLLRRLLSVGILAALVLSVLIAAPSVTAFADATTLTPGLRAGDVIPLHHQWRQVVAVRLLPGSLTIRLVDIATGKPGEPIVCRPDMQFGNVTAGQFQVGHTLTTASGDTFRITSITKGPPVNEVVTGPLTPEQRRQHPLPPGMPQYRISLVEASLSRLPGLEADPGAARLKPGDIITYRDASMRNAAPRRVVKVEAHRAPVLYSIAAVDARTGRPVDPLVCEPGERFRSQAGTVTAAHLQPGTSFENQSGKHLIVLASVRHVRPGGYLRCRLSVRAPQPVRLASLDPRQGMLALRSRKEPALRLTEAELASYLRPMDGFGSVSATADGLRASKTVGGVTTTYVWDTSGGLPVLIGETDTAGNSATFDYGADPEEGPIRVTRNGTAYYPIQDGSGSTRAVTNASGTVVGTAGYDAFGNMTASSGSLPTDFFFNGQQLDAETGNYYLRARYYSPATGRFLTQDPQAGDPFDPITLNKYAYANDDPLNIADPTGHDGELVGTVTSIGIATEVAAEVTPAVVEGGEFAAASTETSIEGVNAAEDASIVDGTSASDAGLEQAAQEGSLNPEQISEIRAEATNSEPMFEDVTERGDLNRLIGNQQRKLIQEFFGTAKQGALNRLATFKVPPSLTRESLELYKEAARRAIILGKDSTGVQTVRWLLCVKALSEIGTQ